MATTESPLSPEEIRKYERRLLDLRSAAADEVEQVEKDSLRPSGDPELQVADTSLEEAVLDDSIDVLETEDEIGYAIHEALDRIRDGTYGTCVTCGRTIPRERLDLLPYADECSACAEASERRRGPGAGS
jgi:RNA polymerase-binding transcription factor